MMSEEQIATRKASTEALFALLRRAPWWLVIIAVVGLVVAFSVLTSARYLDAISFLFDLPWDRELVGQVPVEGDRWSLTREAGAPLAPGTYRFYAEFNEASAAAKPETILYAEPDAKSAQAAMLAEGDVVSFGRWKIIPRDGATAGQNWVQVTTEDGRTGWTLDRQFSLPTYRAVGKSGLYVLQVAAGTKPGASEPITAPTSGALTIDTSTPTISGATIGGSVVRIYNKYDWKQTIARIWAAKGVMMTFRATILGFGLALILGLLAGLMLVSKNPITLAISKLYVEVVRGLPLLVVILYAGFVIAPMLRDSTGGRIDISGFAGAVLGLGFGYGAYLAEVFRAGIQSIHHGQMEAARSLGMSYFQAMRYIVLPQALRVMLPPLGNDFMAMLKDSSLISVVALPEILQQGRLWVSRTFRAFEGYNTVALFYLVMTLLLSLLVRVIERKTALPGSSSEGSK
jgi:polar amino acid transport system permease protein